MRAGVLLGLSVMVALSVAPTPGSAVEDESGALTGTVVDRDGRPLAGAAVEVAVVPPRKGRAASIEPRVVATTLTDETGRYVVEDLPPGLAPESSPVELMVTASKDSDAVHYVLNLEVADDGDRSDGALSLGRLDLQLGEGLASDPWLLTVDSSGGTSEAPDEPPAEDDGSEQPQTGSASSCRDLYATVWVPELDVTRKRMVPIHRLTARRHSTMSYRYESTHRTEMSVAFTGDGGSYAGGLTHSNENSSSLGMLHKVGNGAAEVLKLQWEYMRYRKKCVQSWSGGHSYYLDVYQWRPERKTAGSQTLENEPTWDCAPGRTVPIAVKTWVAREARVRWVGWFTLGGSALDTLQENTESHKLTVFPDSGEEDPRVCGSNDFPVEAHRVKERVD